MTKRQDLYLQRRSRPEQSDQRQANQAANISHQPRASPDSTSLASRIEFPTLTGVVAWRQVCPLLPDHRDAGATPSLVPGGPGAALRAVGDSRPTAARRRADLF